MTFETLANELLLELFEYLNAVHLFRAFHDLNSRINTLLFCRFQLYHLDFQSISKRNFDLICHEQLPFILDQTISLRLSDDDETPTLSNIFLSFGFTLDQFTRLKSLTLNRIYSFDIINHIIIQCRSLSCLTHLTILKCPLHTRGQNIPSLFNHIWNLPKLMDCNLSNTFPGLNLVSAIKSTSVTIENLSLDAIPCDLNDLSNIFVHTPHLRRLRTNISPTCQNQQLDTDAFSLISLKIFYPNSIFSIMIIQNMPNLRYLTIKSTNICLNGHGWETILTDNLPNIVSFRLKMEFTFPYQCDIQQQINQLLDTFQTPFWLEKHRWFVRCYCTIRNGLQIGVLYTLPYIFEEFHFNNEYYSKSTCPNEEDYWSYDNVQNLHMKAYNNENTPQLCTRLPNIRCLKNDLTYGDQLWSCIPSLDQLISLYITLPSKDFHYCQLQSLCERAPCLYSLKLHGLHDFDNTCMISFLSKTSSIRRLDLLGDQCYESKACATLANSFLGKQCEVLLIDVENRTDVLCLMNRMSNLRMLIFRCEYDRLIDADFQMTLKNDELFTWLQRNSPSTCLILRDSNRASSYMRLWIG